MISRVMILFFLILIVTLPAASEDLTLVYLDGFIETDTGSGWQEINIGDRVPSQSYVRLEEDGIAEFSSGDITITINQSGTFLLSELISASGEVSSWGIGPLITTRLNVISGKRQHRVEAVMGVRGAVSDSQELQWMDSEEDEDLIEDGRKLLEDGHYDQAIAAFREAMDLSFDNEERENILFQIAYAHSLAGRTARAFVILAGLNPGLEKSYYHNYVLLKGNILLETLSFRQALDLFNSYLSAAPGGEVVQAVHFLSFFCYQKLGMEQQAARALSDAVKVDPGTEIGYAAGRLLDAGPG